ncbi:DUF1636 family protein [Shimia sp.]|uniref:DUF1636 family protein n=1 Tax=Shimia sp. TaxID=1954381 RepID=UPI003569CC17
MRHTVFICQTCQDRDGHRPGPEMVEALRAALEVEADVVAGPCMNMCDAPVSLALRAPGKVAYLFSRIEAGDVADIAALTRLFVEAEGGVIEDARPAGRLRFCLTGRVPAL